MEGKPVNHNLALDSKFVELEDELDKAISELAAGLPPSKPTMPPVAETYPFKGNSTAEALKAAAEVGHDERPFRRPLTDAERKPIPPQNPVRAAPPPPPEQTTGWHGDPAAPEAPAQPEQAIVSASPTGSEVENFMAIGEKMHDAQRLKIQALESAYEIDRVKLIDDYRVRLRNLEHEAGEALRGFDLAHQAALADAKRILDALTAMRG